MFHWGNLQLTLNLQFPNWWNWQGQTREGEPGVVRIIMLVWCSLTTRYSQIQIASSYSWKAQVTLNPEIPAELRFWLGKIDILNSKNIFYTKPPRLLNVIASDASDSGCGALLNDRQVSARLFSTSEKSKHSTYRELLAVSHALKSFIEDIKYSTVKILVDNQSAARILDVGSMKKELHE